MPIPTIKPKTTGRVETKYLDFDPENPRLIEQGLRKPTDAQIIKALAENADLAEIVQSIAANGYIDIEPLIARRDKARYVVLEGNRRLAAIRLLQNQELARAAGVSAPPKISQEVRESLDEVTVYAVTSPEQARDFIGFKHINGPHKWDAHAKGRFAAEWYRSGKKNGLTLEAIAQRLGDRHDTVVRLVNGVFVLDQAEREKIFSIEDRYPGRKFAFSHLYTALTRSGYREFLGLNEEWRDEDPKPNPVPKARIDNLRKVLVWLYGSKSDDVEPLITSQNPHIKQLGAVLQDARARATLVSRNSLGEAHQQLEPKGARFETALLNAKHEAETALSQIIGFEPADSTLLEAAAELRQTSTVLHATMASMAEPKTDQDPEVGVLSIPDLTEHVTKLADWVELSALLAPNQRVGFSTLVSAADLEVERQEEDIADEDSRHEALVNAVQVVLAERKRVVGAADYPFVVDDDGSAIQAVATVTPAGAIYLFCLFLSHAYDDTIIPKEHAPTVTNEVRDLFQVCATVAAAGYVEGIATSFGWPRPEHDSFLNALKRIYTLFGDGTPHENPPAGAPEAVKDEGIDVIAWKPSPDGLPGTQYLLGQVASGNDWKVKSVTTYIDVFHKFWFSRQPAAPQTPAMFMPFCLEPKGVEDPAEAQEVAVGNMQRYTNLLGVLFYRYRMPHFAAKGIKAKTEHGHLVERIEELPKVEAWVTDYANRLRVVANS